jgi:hypothetical protein
MLYYFKKRAVNEYSSGGSVAVLLALFLSTLSARTNHTASRLLQ